MNRFLTASVFAFWAAALGGCSSYTLRDGVWELSYINLKAAHNGRSLELAPRLVKLEVGSDDNGGEVAQIAELPPPAEPEPEDPKEAAPSAADGQEQEEPPHLTLGPMYGDITPADDLNPGRIKINGADGHWVFSMWGTIKDPETIVGSLLSARGRFRSHLGLEGRWSMRWLRDE